MPEVPPEWLRNAHPETHELLISLLLLADEERMITLDSFFWVLSSQADPSLKHLFIFADLSSTSNDLGTLGGLEFKFRHVRGETMYVSLNSVVSVAEALREPLKFQGVDLLSAYFRIFRDPVGNDLSKQALTDSGIQPNRLELLVTEFLLERLEKEVDSITSDKVDEFHLWIDPGDAPPEVISEVLSALSDLNRAYGGNGLIFAKDESQQPIILCNA